MRRVLSLWLPHWPTDRLRRTLGIDAPPRNVPLAQKASAGSKRIVSSVDQLAIRCGLYPGMSVAKAQVLVSGIALFDADPQGDADALQGLAVWALKRYSPTVAPDGRDGLILDVTGATHLYGGEDGFVTDIIGRLCEYGIEARAALADSWGAAHALARFCAKPSVIVEAGRTVEALLPLPVAAMRLPDDLIEELVLLGIETVGELAAKPRAPMAKRYGPQIFRRIDQAFGRLAEPIQPIDSPELIRVHRVFADPIGAAETLEKYTRRLCAQMCDALEANGHGARRLDLHYFRVDNRIEAVTIATAKPVRDLKRLSKLLCDKIESIDPGFGVEKMVLTAVHAEPLAHSQTTAGFAAPSRANVESLWDTLANRYGEERLYRTVSVATDIPERAVRRLPPTSTETGSRRNARYRRPARMLRPPEPVQAIAVLPDHPPRAFNWRGHRYSVVCADGPERVKGEWWRSDHESGKVRDYFILEVDSGERFWVFRAGDGQHAETGSLNWYMHGKFD